MQENDPIPVRREQFFVQNQGIRLEAELLVPERGELKPAVIFLPGSGASSFQDYIPVFFEAIIEKVFFSKDMCILYMNKRGVGGWREAGSGTISSVGQMMSIVV